MRFHPEVQFHRNTTLPGQEEIVRMGHDVRPLPDWNVAHGVKGSVWMLLILLVKILVNGVNGLLEFARSISHATDSRDRQGPMFTGIPAHTRPNCTPEGAYTLKSIIFINTILHNYKFAKLIARPRRWVYGDNPMSERVYIFDTTLRDGEQSPGCSMTVPEKLRMAHKLVEHGGVDILEAGFPIASQGDYDAVTAVSKEFPLAQVAALARCCTLDVERAAAALSHARQPRIHLVIATSEIHLKHKLKKTQQQVLDEAVAAVELARRHADDVQNSRRRMRGAHRARIPGEGVEGGGVGRRCPDGGTFRTRSGIQRRRNTAR